jgi:hypothetical protein
MEDVMRVWLDDSLQSRPEVSYVRRPAKILRCRNEQAHAFSSTRRKAAIYAHSRTRHSVYTEWIAKTGAENADVQQLAHADATPTNLQARFRKLANEWSSEVSNISSVGSLTSHPKYQEIVRLGWEVVPYLLADLQQNRGFWFTALNEITGIRPFDPSDAGKKKRMTEAWVKWGKRKGII